MGPLQSQKFTFINVIAVCGISIFLLSSCSRTEVVETPPIPIIRDGGALSGDPCGAPCFWEITPGITTKDQVIAILKDRGVYQDCEFFDYSQRGGDYGIDCQPGISISFKQNTEIVIHLGFEPDQNIMISEIIAKYGNPDGVLVVPQGIPEAPPHVSMIIYFDKINTSIILPGQDSAVYELSPRSHITLIGYFVQTEYESNRRDAASWHGYGTYDYNR